MTETTHLVLVDLWCCWCKAVYGNESIQRKCIDNLRQQDGRPVKDGICTDCGNKVFGKDRR